jgi:predicted alpha-1,6-mannanase (GH76 family)
MLDTLQLNSSDLTLFAPTASTEDKAKLVHRLLLDLSKDESEKELRSAVRQTADFFREKFFGLTEKQTRSRIMEVLKDYFDGETHHALEIDNLAEETGIRAEKLLPVVQRMVQDGILIEGRRRRWQEVGKHYNPIYKLKG